MMANDGIPWSNCRIQLASEINDDDDLPQGIVARLFYSPVSHPAVRQSLQALSSNKLSLPAVAVQNLVNRRGPDALVGRIPGETRHSTRLLELCTACHLSGEVLTCSIPAGDVILVPRLPSAAQRDGLYFIAYATNIRAVQLCEELRSLRQVAVVLDIDNTLIDATPAAVDPNDWDSLDWIHTTVSSSTGRRVAGQLAHLPASEGEGPHQERAFLIHWRFGRMPCTFKVRVRPGWAAFRAFLAARLDRFAPFVCSKGKLEYVQLIWMGLDPGDKLIPPSLWPTRISSTYPDTLQRAAEKTALVALGCADVMRPMPPTQLAAPVVCVDDSPEAYAAEYSDSLLYVEEYRPSDGVHTDRGSVLRQVEDRLETYWAASCGEAGSFAWQAAQSFATAILGAMQRTPMESPDALAYLQVRCAKQGTALWRQFTVASCFNNDVYLADQEAAEQENTDPSVCRFWERTSPTRKTFNGGVGGLLGGEVTHPLLREESLAAAVKTLLEPAADNGATGAGGNFKDPGGHRTADDLMYAALMLQC